MIYDSTAVPLIKREMKILARANQRENWAKKGSRSGNKWLAKKRPERSG